ncbi:MAG: DUF1353 domain-containing protein [Armatimonadota bacterium]|nr:DUF1353 domain-containing protein [Armatimonadota bacterium]
MQPVKVSSLDGRRWTLIEPYVWREFTVPAGFVTDFASTPRLIWAWLPPTGKYMGAAVVHDYLYVVDRCTRAEADAVFLEAMADAGVNVVRRRLMYLAVRAFGQEIWDRYRAMDRLNLIAGRGLTALDEDVVVAGWTDRRERLP